MLRLQTYLARSCGLSRRSAEESIAIGRVLVNNQPAELGCKVTEGDSIEFDGKTIASVSPSQRVLLYHKPIGEECSRTAEKSVFASLPVAEANWLSVGRLDVQTSGLLLFCLDGQLAHRLTHPSYSIDREYAVRVHGQPDEQVCQRLLEGVELEDGPAKFLDLVASGSGKTNSWFYVLVQQGRNRLVRRLWASQGFEVSRLIRVRFDMLVLPPELKPGEWVEIGGDESGQLYRSVGLSMPAAPPQTEQTSRSANRPAKPAPMRLPRGAGAGYRQAVAPSRPVDQSRHTRQLQAQMSPARQEPRAGEKARSRPSVYKLVEQQQRHAERGGGAGRAGWTDRPNRFGRQDRLDRPDRPNRSDRSDRPGSFGRQDRPDRPNRSDRRGGFGRQDRPDRPNRSDRPGGFGRQDRQDRSDRQSSFGRQDRPDRSDRPNQHYAGSHNRGDRQERQNRQDRQSSFGRQNRPERSDRPNQCYAGSRNSGDRPERQNRPDQQNQQQHQVRFGQSRPDSQGGFDRPDRHHNSGIQSRQTPPGRAYRQHGSDRPNHSYRPERPERPDRQSSFGRQNRQDRPDRSNHSYRPERPERPDRQSSFGRQNRPDRAYHPGHSDRPDRPHSFGRPNQRYDGSRNSGDGTERQNRPGSQSRPDRPDRSNRLPHSSDSSFRGYQTHQSRPDGQNRHASADGHTRYDRPRSNRQDSHATPGYSRGDTTHRPLRREAGARPDYQAHRSRPSRPGQAPATGRAGRAGASGSKGRQMYSKGPTTDLARQGQSDTRASRPYTHRQTSGQQSVGRAPRLRGGYASSRPYSRTSAQQRTGRQAHTTAPGRNQRPARTGRPRAGVPRG